ncbi:DUF3343 domain-containing protein [Oryzomonas sagensis]|uniref:DUF3343 domain-containing protein n=1 Tax=Oryzomonas sagensis TaxID=2603857 RepID=A0ABQ6TKX2_9BACT|nr:DUF3343 domain-containing protein [Oryzomonas sagensis]KAB0668848.1 DUF3343 domain-containing protein [Oryzomonas sagensis]
MVQEGDLLAVFNSSHRVMKAEDTLRALRLTVLLIPAPRQLQTDCGLALRFRGDIRGQIMEILERGRLLPAFVSEYREGVFITIWADETRNTHII